MRITPSDSWTWSYQSIKGQEYLGLYITLDNGQRYFFRTNLKVQQLAVFPEYGTPFCIRDARLLTDYMNGLNAIGVQDNSSEHDVSINMELALNAVACTLFAGVPKRAFEHAFIPYTGAPFAINRGSVISLYFKDHRVSDFIVLDDVNDVSDGIFRLMFTNRELRIGKNIMSVGAVIKVPRSVIYPFRALSANHSNSINYA